MGIGGLVRRVEMDDGVVEVGIGLIVCWVGGGVGGRVGINIGNWMIKRCLIENG